MTIEIIKNVLLWSMIINYGILFWWFGWMMMAPGFLGAVSLRQLRRHGTLQAAHRLLQPDPLHRPADCHIGGHAI